MQSNQHDLLGWAHDLRTIASTLLTHADLYGLSEGSKEEFLDAVRANCGMIVDFADGLAMMGLGDCGESGQSALAGRGPLRHALDSVIDAFALAAKAKGCQLTLQTCDDLLSLPPKKTLAVQRLVSNLVSNAIRHSQSKRLLVVFDRAAKRKRHREPKGVRFVLQIKDDGVGLKPDQIRKLTSPNRRSDVGKPGGLRTVEQLVQSLGGKLVVSTAPGRGTTITVTFSSNEDDSETRRVVDPDLLLDSSLPVSGSGPSIGHGGASGFSLSDASGIARDPKKVLLIDDDPTIVELLRTLCDPHGIHIFGLAAPSAVTTVDLAPYEMILLDLALGNLDGCCVAELLRGRGYHRNIVAFSASPPSSQPQWRQQQIAALFDGWIDKAGGGTRVVMQLRDVIAA